MKVTVSARQYKFSLRECENEFLFVSEHETKFYLVQHENKFKNEFWCDTVYFMKLAKSHFIFKNDFFSYNKCLLSMTR